MEGKKIRRVILVQERGSGIYTEMWRVLFCFICILICRKTINTSKMLYMLNFAGGQRGTNERGDIFKIHMKVFFAIKSALVTPLRVLQSYACQYRTLMF